MNKRERLLRAFDFQETDRVPIVDWIQHGGLAAVVSGRDVSHDFWTLAECGKIAANYLDMAQDLTPSFPQDDTEIEEMTPEVDGTETWYTHRKPDGLVYRRNYWMGAVVEHPFADEQSAVGFLRKKIQELERRLGERDFREEKRAYQQTVARKQRLMGDTELLFMTPNGGLGVDTLYTMLGWRFFSLLIYDHPDLIETYVDRQTLYDYQWVENVVDGPDLQAFALVYCDIASTTGLMLSPEWIRNIMYPKIERLCAFYRNKGIRVMYHSEGNITKVIDDLISLGVEGINPLEKTVSGMSVPEVRKRWPSLVLWGGVDNKDLLVHGTVDEVKKEVEFLTREYGKYGGLLLGSSGQVHPGCKTENVLAMYETALSTT